MNANRHGLARSIPANVRREVRKRSKFGCVVCRAGVFEYEHFDPPFRDATAHSPDGICCLCGTCHSLKERGHLAVGQIRKSYEALSNSAPDQVEPAWGLFRYDDDVVDVRIGGVTYLPPVECVLRYMGTDVIRMTPRTLEEPAALDALFTDAEGRVILELEQNGWVASPDTFDVEVVQNRLTVRTAHRVVALRIRTEPDAPGRLVLERLDMRVGHAHVLASETSLAVGVLDVAGRFHWVSGQFQVYNANPRGVAIEIMHPDELRRRMRAHGLQQTAIISQLGLVFPAAGVALASNCGQMTVMGTALGVGSLDNMRKAVFFGTGPAELLNR